MKGQSQIIDKTLFYDICNNSLDSKSLHTLNFSVILT